MTAISSMESLCARIAQHLEQSVGDHKYRMWFDRAARMNFHQENNRLEVAVPNRFVADWINRNFDQDLKSAAQHAVGHAVDVHIEVHPELFAVATVTATEPLPVPTPGLGTLQKSTAPSRRTNGVPGLPPRHRMEDFIVGPSNELAFAAAVRLAEGGDTAASPLFFHGACGLGKTHLLQGICRRTLDRNPQAKVVYTTGEQFTNEFITAVRSNTVAAFRRKVRHLDLLAIDDIHFLASKQATQQEFQHSFDDMEMHGARIVMASDCHPRLIRQLNQALVSRCIRGMVVEVRSPDTQTRARIVRALAEKRGLSLLDTVVQVIASRCVGSVRDIEGTLTKLQALVQLSQHGTRPTPRTGSTGAATDPTAASDPHVVGHTYVERLFESELASQPRRAVRFDSIVDVVTSELGITPDRVRSRDRHPPTVLARSLIVHLAKRMTSKSYPEIAAEFGRGGHSGVLTADQRIRQLIAKGQSVSLASGENVTVSALADRLQNAAMRAKHALIVMASLQ